MTYTMMEPLENRRLLTAVNPTVIVVPVDLIPVDPPIVIADPGNTDGSSGDSNGSDQSTDPTTDPTTDPSGDVTTDPNGDGSGDTGGNTDGGGNTDNSGDSGGDVWFDPGPVMADGMAPLSAAGLSKLSAMKVKTAKTVKAAHHARTPKVGHHAKAKAKAAVHSTTKAGKHVFNSTRRIGARTRMDVK